MHFLKRKHIKQMRTVISLINQKERIPKELTECCYECLELGYIGGIKCYHTGTGIIVIDYPNPYVTLEGLSFYEKRYPNLKTNVSLVLSILGFLVSVLSNLGNIASALNYLKELLSSYLLK